jgi:hypothetical protein
MSLDMSQIFGLGAAIIGLAVVAVVIINGKETAAVITASGNAFVNAIKAATNPGQTNANNQPK